MSPLSSTSRTPSRMTSPVCISGEAPSPGLVASATYASMTDSVLPSAVTTPRSSQIASLHSCATASRLWLTKTTVRPSLCAVHPPDTLGLELRIAHCEHLVHDEDVGLDVCRDREGETQVHARGVALDGCIDESLDTRKGDDLVEAARHVAAAHSQDGAVEEQILAPGELAVESGAHLEQRGNPSTGPGNTRRRLRDSGKDLQAVCSCRLRCGR